MPFPQDASLPKDSLILVTGVTGFLASIIANELLNHGYRKEVDEAPNTTKTYSCIL